MTTIDVHCHAALSSWLFDSNFETDHPTLSKDFFPFSATVDYPKMARGQVDAILSSAYLPESPLLHEADPSGKTRKMIDFLFKTHDKSENNDYPDQPFDQTMKILDCFEDKIKSARQKNCAIDIARNFDEFTNLLAQGTKAVVHSIEGGHSLGRAIGGNAPAYIKNLDALFERGVALLTIAHAYENDIVAPVVGMPPSIIKTLKLSDVRDLTKGLTETGKEVVSRMFDIGMIVDLTHCTPKAREQIYEINDERGSSRRPLVFSHVGIAEMFNHPMNPTASEIVKIKECGGTIGFLSDNYWLMGKEEKDPIPFIELKEEPGIGFIVEMIEKIHAVSGTFDSISVGSDLDGFTDPSDDLYNTARFTFLRKKLVERFGDDATEKIMGGNALRVLENGWGNNA
jgi:microsomal dipeptidase-like Zn-dependent dipeptidase